jgi:hypothetical protein
MRTALVMFCLWSVGAWADTPTATGLDRLAQVLPGTWKTQGQTFDGPVSKAGPQNYVTRRDCWRDKDAYKCVSVVNGTLQLFDIFSWDATAGVYHQTRITPQGRQPEFTVSVKGDTWTYDQDITRADGSVVHYRVTRVFTTAASQSYAYTYSADTKQWVDVAKGDETLIASDR